MEDILPLLSPIVSAVIAVFGAYQATKRASEDRERERDRKANERDIQIKTELAAMSTELRLLSERVGKHNNLDGRMVAVETEITNIYHRIDEWKKGA